MVIRQALDVKLTLGDVKRLYSTNEADGSYALVAVANVCETSIYSKTVGMKVSSLPLVD